jgi:hypothetical protein
MVERVPTIHIAYSDGDPICGAIIMFDQVLNVLNPPHGVGVIKEQQGNYYCYKCFAQLLKDAKMDRHPGVLFPNARIFINPEGPR